MQDREIQHYHIQGYGTFFEEALPSIKSTLDKKLGEMEWADFVKGTQKCRGYFTMLMAVECLYVDVTGRSVTLCTARPYHPGDISKKIKDIVPRFMLEQNGVILEGEEIQCAL